LSCGSRGTPPRSRSVLPVLRRGSRAAVRAACPALLPRHAGQQPRDPHVRRESSGFGVWADERVPDQPSAMSPAWRLRHLIAGQIRALPAPAGRVLHAGYSGQRRSGTDVENLLFNNIDQGLTLFRKPGGTGIRFEDLGPTVPHPTTTAVSPPR
jgi:hypothetical protein